MPIYQYRCNECDHEMEALQKMSDPKLEVCPECSVPALKKQVTAAAFKLKGTGWYETDFKNSGAKPEAAATSESATSEPNKTAASSSDDSAKTKSHTTTPSTATPSSATPSSATPKATASSAQ